MILQMMDWLNNFLSNITTIKVMRNYRKRFDFLLGDSPSTPSPPFQAVRLIHFFAASINSSQFSLEYKLHFFWKWQKMAHSMISSRQTKIIIYFLKILKYLRYPPYSSTLYIYLNFFLLVTNFFYFISFHTVHKISWKH